MYFLPIRNKFVYSYSVKICASGFDELSESIFFLLLVVEVFSLQKLVKMLEEVVVDWQEVRWIWQPSPVLLPGESHGQRSLVGCSPWGCEESDVTERLHFHFSLSCTGEGPGMAGPGGLPSMGSHRVEHDWSDLAAIAACWVYRYLQLLYLLLGLIPWSLSSVFLVSCNCL